MLFKINAIERFIDENRDAEMITLLTFLLDILHAEAGKKE